MQIYYFSRTGRSKSIADALAARYGVQARQIDDHTSWQGSLGYIRAAISAMRGKSLPIDYKKPDADETVALVFPIWAGGAPPAVNTFMKEVGRARIIAAPTSLGSTMKDRAGFVKVIDLVGKEISAPEGLE